MEETPRTIGRWLALYLLARAVVLTVVGLLLVVRPDESLSAIARLAGALVAMVGVIDVVASIRAPAGMRAPVVGRGFLGIAAGVVVYLLADATVTVVAIVIGMYLVVAGGVSVLLALRLRGRLGIWRGVALRGVIALGAGVIAVVWPGIGVVGLGILLGVQALASGLVSTAVSATVLSRPA